MPFVAESHRDSKLVPTRVQQSPSLQQLLSEAFRARLTGARAEGEDGGGHTALPHPPAAVAAAREPQAPETCPVSAGAWPRREAEGVRGPRLLTRPCPSRAPPGEAAQPPPPAQPARPPALRPRPRGPRLPDARQAPYPRGAGPRGALPRMSVPVGSAPRAQGPEHRAGASQLSRPLSPSARSQASLGSRTPAPARTPLRSRSLPRSPPPPPPRPTPLYRG